MNEKDKQEYYHIVRFLTILKATASGVDVINLGTTSNSRGWVARCSWTEVNAKEWKVIGVANICWLADIVMLLAGHTTFVALSEFYCMIYLVVRLWQRPSLNLSECNVGQPVHRCRQVFSRNRYFSIWDDRKSVSSLPNKYSHSLYKNAATVLSNTSWIKKINMVQWVWTFQSDNRFCFFFLQVNHLEKYVSFNKTNLHFSYKIPKSVQSKTYQGTKLPRA